ncbi:uncharacterized protein N7459_005419 [Penicillium hispanicum]|uniref:uncharacterized protein n=1 Tax=Penicillium hispanicum TaxID=1080232 RepID=UPI002540090F|nr:uncharacterized protein N7459_005419 [Penicillium hispanicum]KAJ5585619.1 hypothetical protein N7459_005419 [Penicillium hispanicum]
METRRRAASGLNGLVSAAISPLRFFAPIVDDYILRFEQRADDGWDSTGTAFIAPLLAPAAQGARRGWRPLALRPPYLASLVSLMMTMLLVLEGLRQYSERKGGLVFFNDTNDVSSLQSFAYNYVPIIVALCLVMAWTVTDFDVLRLEPYFQLSRPEGAPATVLFINYNFGQTILTPINSARRRHWIVFWVSLMTISIRMILPALQSTVFEVRGVEVIDHTKMRGWPTLVDLETQATWMSTQANNTVNSVLSTDEAIRRSRSDNYAVAPLEIPSETNKEESTLWTLDQTIYWADVSCEDVPVNENLLVTITNSTHGFPQVSWNATGIDLQDDYGNSSQCQLDFHYESIFFPETDYLQVRYWEPAMTPEVIGEFPNRTKAFTATGCDPYDLYGMLIEVNATVPESSSTHPQYSSSGLAFACDITYHKAEARVSMHSNSSITSIYIKPGTTSTVTAAEFNIDHFQGLLSQRAPYTSDMIFIHENATTGARAVTELPVISIELGDLQPLLVLDTSSTMTQAEFESKIIRDVKQTFVLTLGRLFDPDRKPTVISATRHRSQVAIAVVTFAALWSELILGLATLTALYLLFLYRSRETFLQSDPGSIGAMCGIATDVFHSSNVLSEPHPELHQFSTRQLRRIFRNARCHWRPGPTGNRLEILAEDGSPVQLGESLQSHVDPMPHFLVIPFFIVEFLALAAVIILMGLVISSLLRDGRFRHLTQSDSSSLQVILSFLPSVVASCVSSLCTSIHRNISVLEPWVHLQRGMASAQASLLVNYSSQSPLAIFFKAIRHRHVLLGLVSLACVINMALTVVAGGLFTQELTSSVLPTHDLTMNYSQSMFWRTDFAAEFTEYDLIQTSITSGVPVLPWTSANQSFVPLDIYNRNSGVMYGANTLGVGTSLQCQPLSPDEGLAENKTSGDQYWHYSMFDNSSTQCIAHMPPLQGKDEGIALSIHFLSPYNIDLTDVCETSTVLVVGRWDYMPDTAITDNNTIALHCEPHARLQNFSVTFDQRGQIDSHEAVANTSITEGVMYDNATVSLGQFNKVFAAIPESYVGNTTSYNGTYNISSYDWAGFLVARLYERYDPDFDSLNPDRMIDMTQTVYQWVYSTYFSLWRDIYLNPLDHPVAAVNATVIQSTWCMVASIPSISIALIIIVFDTFVVLVVFGTRRGRFSGPRMPRSIGAVIPWIAHSQMLSDFTNTHQWTSRQRREHLKALDKRYGFRMFMGPDGRWRFAVDEEPTKAERPSDTDDSQDADAQKTSSIQLQELPDLHSRVRA